MNRYNSYKDCGIYYLPILPAGWKIRKAKYLFNQEKRVPRKEDEIVTCFRDGQVTLRKNRRTEGFTNSLKEIGYQGIRKGDLVIHNMDAFAGAIGVSDSDGKGTPVYTVCTPKGKDINQYFYCYFLRVLSKQGFIQSLAKGIRERSTDFRWSDFKEVYFPIPTIEEQNAIVSYIRTTTSKLDAAIAREQKMIDLLNERKQIIINHAVTKGLNPNAKLKDSGVDWIGEIPEGWETIPLRFVFEIRNGYTPSKSVKEYWEDGIIPWYRMEDIHKSGRILHDSIQHITKKAIKGGGLFSACSFILATCTASIGEHAMLMVDSLANQRFINLKIGEAYSSKYNPLYIYFYMFIVGKFCRHTSNSTTFQNADINELKNFPILLPSIEEQNSIVDRLKSRLKDLDETLDKTSKMISLLQERKQIIINDVVTGKIKVF